MPPKVQLPSGLVNHSWREPFVYRGDHIIVPFVKKTRVNLGVEPSQPALAIFDHFKVGTKQYSSVLVPASCTDKLQPFDVSVNRAAKAFLERHIQDWYANQELMNKRGGGVHACEFELG